MKRLITLMIWAIGGMTAAAQSWAPTSGPQGATVASIAAHDSTLLAIASPDALFRYTSGSGWTLLTRTFGNELYSVGNVYIARGFDRLLRSTDRGTSWEGTGPAGSNYRVAIDGEVLYAAVDSVIHRSTDRGATWHRLADAGRDFFTFHAGDSVILLSRGAGGGVFRSGDTGRTWSSIPFPFATTDPPTRYLRDGGVIYAATSSHGVYRSSDAGRTWSAMNEGLPAESGALPLPAGLLAAEGRLWFATSFGTFVWTGSRWETRSIERASAIASGGAALYVGGSTGVSAATLAGANWRSINQGLMAHRAIELVRYGNAAIVGAGGYLFRSQNLGKDWTRLRPLDVERIVASDHAVYALGWGLRAGGFYRSLDGVDWGDAGKGLPHPIAWANGLAASGDTVYVGFRRYGWEAEQEIWIYGGVYRSTDRGDSWKAVNAGLPNDGHGDVPVLDLFALGRVVLAHTHDGLYRSTDGGELWTRVDPALPANTMPARMAAIDGKLFLAAPFGVYRSLDSGLTWSQLTAGLPQGGVIQHISTLRGTAYISATIDTQAARIFRLDGDRWSNITGDFPAGVEFNTFVDMGSKVLAGTSWSGVWAGRLAEPSGVGSRDDRSSAMSLRAAPNPFGDELALTFTAPGRAHARLALLSSLGDEVATLHDGVVEQGEHTLRVDRLDLPAGVYHARLTMGGATGMVKLVKLR